MKTNIASQAVFAAAASFLSFAALAECIVPEDTKKLDPVEVGFCESDAVFVGKVQARLETVRAFRAEGSEQTQHFRTETSTVQVLDTYKGAPPKEVKMNAELYDKGETFSFGIMKEYLIFAKRLADTDRYSGATAKCSVQSTLPIADAAAALKRLDDHKSGRKRIDCNNIRPKGQN
jgi:hypothetical protein